jgi:hypothetical protein
LNSTNYAPSLPVYYDALKDNAHAAFSPNLDLRP